MKVLYFAHIKDLINRDNDVFSFAHPITTEVFKKHLIETYPFLKGESFQLAVNEEFVQEEDLIHDGDTVALIPPVSGG